MDGLESRIVLALLLAAAMGLERQSYVEHKGREKVTHHGVIGIRSHMLIGILGIVTGLTVGVYPLLAGLIGAGFLILLLTYYVLESRITTDYGPTTELNMIWCYGMSTLLTTGIIGSQIIVSLVAVGLFIMSTKNKVHSLVDSIRWHHIQQLILFGIIALVVLPYLPDTSITLGDIPHLELFLKTIGVDMKTWAALEIINPYSVWRVVVLITGVEIIAFILQQLMGQRSGWIVASLVGGFISSTSTTISLASAYRRHKQLAQSVAGILLANIASFLPMLLMLIATNVAFTREMLPLLAGLTLIGIILTAYFLTQATSTSLKLETTDEPSEPADIFTLYPAIKFALIFSLVKVITKVSYVLLGDAGFLIGSMVAGVSGMDAVTINSAQLAGTTISMSLASLSLVAANTVNFAAKAVYTGLSGDRRLGVTVGVCFAIMTVGMLITSWII